MLSRTTRPFLRSSLHTTIYYPTLALSSYRQSPYRQSHARLLSTSSITSAIGDSRDSRSRSRLSSSSSPRVRANIARSSPPPGTPAGSTIRGSNAASDDNSTPLNDDFIIPTPSSSSSSSSSSLNPPVNIAYDPNGILKPDHPASRILENSAVMIQRQVELGNILLGFEQANKYVIMDPQGNHIGFLAEERKGILNEIGRQMFRTHRAFTAHVFDKHEKEVLVIHRPFSWVNSRVKVFDPLIMNNRGGGGQWEMWKDTRDYRVIGEVQQRWHLLRRKYDLFLHHQPPTSTIHTSGSPTGGVGGGGMFSQFAYIDEPMLSWDFSLRSADDSLVGAVNKNFVGLARELFTDTSVYALKMDAAMLEQELHNADPEFENDVNQFIEMSKELQAELHASGPENVRAFREKRYDDISPYSLGVKAKDLGKIADKMREEGRRIGYEMQRRKEIGGVGQRAKEGMTLDERAVMLATAVTIDYDYFSRHSERGGGGWGLAALWAMIFSTD